MCYIIGAERRAMTSFLLFNRFQIKNIILKFSYECLE